MKKVNGRLNMPFGEALRTPRSQADSEKWNDHQLRKQQRETDQNIKADDNAADHVDRRQRAVYAKRRHEATGNTAMGQSLGIDHNRDERQHRYNAGDFKQRHDDRCCDDAIKAQAESRQDQPVHGGELN